MYVSKRTMNSSHSTRRKKMVFKAAGALLVSVLTIACVLNTMMGGNHLGDNRRRLPMSDKFGLDKPNKQIYEEGDLVKAKYDQDGKWYPAIITKDDKGAIQDNDDYFIKWQDSPDRLIRKSYLDIRPGEDSTWLFVNAEVMATINETEMWYPCKITFMVDHQVYADYYVDFENLHSKDGLVQIKKENLYPRVKRPSNFSGIAHSDERNLVVVEEALSNSDIEDLIAFKEAVRASDDPTLISDAIKPRSKKRKTYVTHFKGLDPKIKDIVKTAEATGRLPGSECELDIRYMFFFEYESGHEHKWHQDGLRAPVLKNNEWAEGPWDTSNYSMVIMLSDGFEGGHFQSAGARDKSGNYVDVRTHDLKKGDAVIFDTSVSSVHHRVTEITGGKPRWVLALSLWEYGRSEFTRNLGKYRTMMDMGKRTMNSKRSELDLQQLAQARESWICDCADLFPDSHIKKHQLRTEVEPREAEGQGADVLERLRLALREELDPEAATIIKLRLEIREKADILQQVIPDGLEHMTKDQLENILRPLRTMFKEQYGNHDSQETTPAADDKNEDPANKCPTAKLTGAQRLLLEKAKAEIVACAKRRGCGNLKAMLHLLSEEDEKSRR